MKGYSLHIGINVVDNNVYEGLQQLNAAVNDADWWEKYAKGQGYNTQKLTDADACSQNVLAQLQEYSQNLQPGDILLLTYSGHGGIVPNEKPSTVDNEPEDQTWCLYDRQMLDDELYDKFKDFKKGTRILVVSDSCHSGTVTKDVNSIQQDSIINLDEVLADGMDQAFATRGFANRKLRTDIQSKIMHRDFERVYQPIQDRFKYEPKRKKVLASVKLLAACQDNQSTYDGAVNGLFTETLAKVLENDTRALDAFAIISAIKKYYAYPYPNYFEYGSIIKSWDSSFPFAIEIKNATEVSGYLKPRQTTIKDLPVKSDITRGIVNRNAILVAEFTAAIPKFEERNDVKIVRQHGAKLVLEIAGAHFGQGWTAAHALQTRLQQLGYPAIVEPVLSYNPSDSTAITRATSGDENYIWEWPPAREIPSVKIGWHLDEQHSQLSAAAKEVMEKAGTHIRVAHIDTGYLPGHIGLPMNLQTNRERNFVSGPGEMIDKAVDRPRSGNDGHGLGTICLLAGNNVPSTSFLDGEFSGFIGGVPFAEVVPIRISDSVAILNTENFCDAIDYALEQGCEVVTMSMAGKPSPRMARAVNRAYEAGVVVVSAASNCWYDGFFKPALPKCVLYPAAFKRVIAATGALYNHQPYDFNFLYKERGDFTKYLQGCWGPPSSMTRALGAYTPNTPWAVPGNKFVKSGGGTSSATPQIAATAALWIAYHREELENKGYYLPGQQWKKVEAVRYALFESAAKNGVFAEWKKYYGNGIIRAKDALRIAVPDAAQLKKSPEAESSFGGIFELIGSFFKNRHLFKDAAAIKPREEQLAVELMQLLQTDPIFFERYSELDMADAGKVGQLVNDGQFQKDVLASPYASPYLKQAFVE